MRLYAKVTHHLPPVLNQADFFLYTQRSSNSLALGVCHTVNASLKQMSTRAFNRLADQPQECVCLRKKRAFQLQGKAKAKADDK